MTLLIQWLTTLAGFAVALFALWRINAAPGRGAWDLKVPLWAMFVFAAAWALDRLTGDAWRVDHAGMLAAIALYLWAGVRRHYRADRRKYMRPEWPPASLERDGGPR